VIKVRIGKFGFLNNFLPYFLLEQNSGIDTDMEIYEGSPRELTAMFERGELDFAPLPSFYYIKNKARLRSYEFCVASKDSVLSVLLVSERGIRDEEGCIAVTNQTVTSLNLLKVILKEKGWRNEIYELNEIEAGELLKHGTYALVIGDEALKARERYRVVMDLGEEWHELTGYPMVFGISVSPNGIDMSEANSAVMRSLEWGEKNIEEVLREAKKRFSMPDELLERYLNTLTYRLGERERKGLEIFEAKCHEYRLL